jgi:hypothetical protein
MMQGQRNIKLWNSPVRICIIWQIPGRDPKFHQPPIVDIDNFKILKYKLIYIMGHAVAQLTETTMRYKSEGRGFDSRWCNWNFTLK